MSLADHPFSVPGPAALATLAVLAVGGVCPAAGQTPRDVVSKTVSVGSQTSTLALGFAGGEELRIALSEGEVRIGDEVVGRFESGDGLDGAWRELLALAVARDDGPLARTLVDWAPPAGLDGAAADAAARIDEALEGALLDEVPTPAPPAPAADARPSPDAIALRSLVSIVDRVEGLSGLAEALDDLDLDEVRMSIGEDLSVGDGEVVDGTVLVVDGDLRVAGRIRGDAVVIDGDVELVDGGRIDGDVRIADGSLRDEGGRLEGAIVQLDRSTRDMEVQLRDEIRNEIRSEIRAATRASRDSRRPSAVSRAFGGIGGALASLFTVLVVAIVGAVVIHFAGPNLDAVAETARRTPGRALMVGTAGAFLVLPAFVLGIVALAISIIGIPALILWIPLFPVAVVLAGGLGYLAVARNVGIWAARQDFPYMGWVRLTNPVTLIAGGALALALPVVSAELVGVVPWTGALQVLLKVIGFMAGLLAILLGFGAVLLTRAGRKPEFFEDDLFAGWGSSWGSGSATMDEVDDLVDDAADDLATTVDDLAHEVEEVVDEAAQKAAKAASDAAETVSEAAHDLAEELDAEVDEEPETP